MSEKRPYTKEELITIAGFQKTLVLSLILGLLVFPLFIGAIFFGLKIYLIFYNDVYIPTHQLIWMSALGYGLIFFLCETILVIFLVFQFFSAAELAVFFSLWALFLFYFYWYPQVSLIGLLLLLAVNQKTTKFLRSNGISVGFLGVSHSNLFSIKEWEASRRIKEGQKLTGHRNLSEEDLRTIVGLQKAVLISIPTYSILFFIGFTALLVFFPKPTPIQLFIFTVIYFLFSSFFPTFFLWLAYKVFQLEGLVAIISIWFLLFVFSFWHPSLALAEIIICLIINQRAISVLKNNGIPVGFFGARRSDILPFKERESLRILNEMFRRTPITKEELFTNFFSDSEGGQNIPERIREIFAYHMNISEDKIYPDDDFSFFWIDRDMSKLIAELEKEFEIQISEKEAEDTACTIRDISQLVWKKKNGVASNVQTREMEIPNPQSPSWSPTKRMVVLLVFLFLGGIISLLVFIMVFIQTAGEKRFSKEQIADPKPEVPGWRIPVNEVSV